jgi:hypothetical protein
MLTINYYADHQVDLLLVFISIWLFALVELASPQCFGRSIVPRGMCASPSRYLVAPCDLRFAIGQNHLLASISLLASPGF